ncbi:hypothetical protein XV54_002200 [Salmonella enterica subsp. enterica]|uniref:hypothetical protein n=1 Tax=Salmonella enterica TaxID=28901 RepID=UPI001602EA56|nr:hypothetical protein [Salmonella enterica]EED6909391.1 hypothetical protein [Salmonella enterica subsp. enterica serovar Lerum]
MTNTKLTDEEINELVLKLFDGYTFYFQSGRRAGAKTMAELLNKAACAVIELQERYKAGERLQESAYKSGLTAGWNFGIEHNSAGFSKCLAAHEYAAPQPALQPSVGFVDATGTDCECVCPACKHEFSIQFEY